ncbi:glycerophosphodiester phosphodiesterase [Pseudalkalibacillus sp. SCS-8]|uniref:glycerophosphodiester phosphodiesterase n=1 Tax=Pseudalkalibacillus nanhaiensis TaxID=3115291 RepID=UPI0032DBA93D
MVQSKFRRLGMLLFSLSLVMLFVTIPSVQANSEEEDDQDDGVEVVAHRGAAGYAPENTIAAFEKAVDMDSDYIELDVQMSKDGQLVVIHDTTVDRTTDGTGKVGDLTYDALRELDAGSWFAPEFKGEHLPTLGEVLDEFRGKTKFLIELKAPSLYPGIEEKVAKALEARDMDDPEDDSVIVQSFDFNSMKMFNELNDDVPVGVLTWKSEDLTPEALEAFTEYADYVNPSKSKVDRELVNQIHDLDMGIMPWTVRAQEDVQPLMDAGVDGIITDYPDYVPEQSEEDED